MSMSNLFLAAVQQVKSHIEQASKSAPLACLLRKAQGCASIVMRSIERAGNIVTDGRQDELH